MDMSQYRTLFVSESRGHIEAFNALIVQLEQNAGEPGLVHELFRHAHSLKGMAATMQFNPIAGLAHRMEDLLGRVRNGEFIPSPAMIDLLLEGCDLLGGMVDLVEAGNDASLPDPAPLIARLVGFDPAAAVAPVTQRQPATSEQPADPSASSHQFRHSDTFKTVRIKTETLDHLVNITGELVTTRHGLAEVVRSNPGRGLEEPLGRLSVLLRELREEVFQARMLPFAIVAERFPRLVRDLARSQNKEINIHIEGREIELDRGILEEIAEPLVHILRNAVDHGLEASEERKAAGKAVTGQIEVSVARDKEHVTIAVADDGRGMDPLLLVEKGVEKGLITSEQGAALSAQEALMLICTAGFSTASEISDVSGRGVGMDAVKSAVHSIGGTLTVESERGRGSRFILKLPISVSIIHALLVECGRLTVAFPVNGVDRTLEITREELIEQDGEKSCVVGDKKIALKHLNRLLGQPLPQQYPHRIPVLVSGGGTAPTGLIIDRIIGQQEIFVKPLGLPLSRLRSATGGAVLGDGKVVFVLDISTFTLPAGKGEYGTFHA